MSRKKSDQQTILEIILVLICLALCGLLYRVGPYRPVVLNLFYLPVVLAAFYLGRYRAGILALLCVICAAVITALDLNTLAAFTSPLSVGLALTIWGAVMGINSLLVGTLSDERIGQDQRAPRRLRGGRGSLGKVPQQLRSENLRPHGEGGPTQPRRRRPNAAYRTKRSTISGWRPCCRTSRISKSRRRSFARPWAISRSPDERSSWSTRFMAASSFNLWGRCSPGPCRCWSIAASARTSARRTRAATPRRSTALGAQIIRTARDYVTLLYRDPSMNPRKAARCPGKRPGRRSSSGRDPRHQTSRASPARSGIRVRGRRAGHGRQCLARDFR